MNVEEQSEFGRICGDSGVCHCDWRLTITNCEEASALKIVYIINAVLSAVLAFTAAFIVFQRVYYHQQTLFDCRTGIPRPKPIESMGVMGVVFHLLRVVHAIILVLDAAPNVGFRSFLFEFPWQFAFGALACYLFGIAHTLSNSSKVIYDNWIRSPYIIDGACVAVITLPYITNNICAIAAGVFADRGDFVLAANFTDALYYLWTFYTTSLAILILYAGFRLIRLLRHHFIDKPGATGEDVNKFSLGALKVKIIILTAFFCLILFAIMVVLYGVSRVSISLYMPYNLTFAVIWTFNGSIATGLIIFAVILNPRMATLAGLVSSSTGGGENTGISFSRMSKWLNSRGSMTSASATTAINSSDLPKSRMQTSEKKSLDLESVSRVSSGYSNSRHHYQSIEMIEHSQIQSRVEEDQLQYNAMTSTIRAPPRNATTYTDDSRYRL
ncbi:hypothetical protein BDB00DRAFT_983982 [Zychaea mexicana]|uniref:uncharacterized protein n=1 Tax=Zychaea mexicana TaxID=64656 RepID=UPI0022FE61DA|nr:uncharacterized protein BDB00DRAFT_983982 [Zychaea mexicana]KAI9484572.1 hypothetical protein BDB00DRAFT_983982 [Zychaea mexicana]